MGTKTLNDIHTDLKLLINNITSFEDNEEGFNICERFALSNIRHHRYLSVNSHATKKVISDIAKKFSIHGKYEVAKKFEELINTFLTSFDFEHHPQYDLQWSLLTLLIDLSTETHKSSLKNIKPLRGENSLNIDVGNDITEEIDWADYLKEGQEDFFHDYGSDSETEWSDDTENGASNTDVSSPITINVPTVQNVLAVKSAPSTLHKWLEALAKEVESRNWLQSNVQHSWWNEIKFHKCPVDSRLPDANLCDIWDASTCETSDTVSTLSEYQVCKELLWMFHVQAQMVVFQRKDKNFYIRSNTSIPSLTSNAFSGILLQFCTYFSMLYDMQQFGAELYRKYNESDVSQKPPFMYEAYSRAVEQHLLKYRSEIIEIERDVMEQDNCNTILSISRRLEKCLNSIRTIYEIHKRVATDWKGAPNWKSASVLLSGLYFEMQNLHSWEKANICADLYLACLTVYLNIIDIWLTEGRLEDWRDEFIIVRVSKSVTDENEQCESFAVRTLDDICKKDPIMQFLIRKVQHMGHNIELLVSLDRIADMWKANNESDENRTCLNDEFYDKLIAVVSKYNSSNPAEETEAASRPNERFDESESDIEGNIIQQLSSLNNPFFIKAMEEYLPADLYRKDIVEDKNSRDHDIVVQNNVFGRPKETSHYILPFRKILENTLSEILDSRYNNASRLVKNIMMQEYKLGTHLKLMRSVYMMETGHVMNKFYQILFSEIESNQIWNNSYYLSCILEEILSQQWPDSSSRWSISVCDVSTYIVPKAVDSIKLHYAIGWPIGLVLNEASLSKYNEIFKFQLKLKWALWTLHNLRFSDLEGSKISRLKNKIEHFQIRRLESLRFWLLHAIGSIHAYLSGQVLQSLGFTLEKAIIRAESLDMIILAHTEYLDEVHQHCLLTAEFEDIMATINNLIEMCIHVRDRWGRRKLLLATAELDVMESSYIKYHTYLALALHNAVQHKDADYYKLTPKRQVVNSSVTSEESDTTVELIADLSRNILTEVAHQNLPPSGISIPIPKLIQNRYWQRTSSAPSLPDEVSLNEYTQTFSYLRWYRYEEHFTMLHASSYILCQELKSLLNESNSDDDVVL